MKRRQDDRPSKPDLARDNDDVRGRGEGWMSGRGEAEETVPPADTTSRQSRNDLPPQPSSEPGAQREAVGVTQLFPRDEAESLRARWADVQTAFVDEPREAVERADTLVADVVKRLVDIFSAERTTLERQWDGGDRVSTEDLRMSLQRYRAFFDRLLSV